MAVSFKVTLARDESGGYSKGANEDAMRSSFNIKYHVDVITTAGDEAKDVRLFQVLAAPDLPKVNLSVYFENGRIIPFLMCRRKTGRRDPRKAGRWEVDTQWDSGEANGVTEGQEQDAPDQLTDISPRVEAEFGDDSEVVYTDKSQPPKQCKLPTGNFFAEPFIEEQSVLRLKITQYESLPLSYLALMGRRKALNRNDYRGFPRGWWKIQHVEFTPARVQLAGGSVLAAQVVYTIDLSSKNHGWYEERALIDSHYLDEEDGWKKKPFIDDEFGTFTTGLIEFDGRKKADQLGPLSYTYWLRLQPFVDFNSFLQA